MNTPTIVLFRHDLRVEDNPTLTAAVDSGGPVIAVFVWSPDEEGEWRAGPASRWWLRRSLEHLNWELENRGATLTLVEGPTVSAIERLVTDTGARGVFWSRRYEPHAEAVDRQLATRLEQRNLHTGIFDTTLLSTTRVLTGSGTSFQKFTPFYKKFLAEAVIDSPVPAPRAIPSTGEPFSAESRRVLDAIEPRVVGSDWNPDAFWKPGSAGAETRLKAFLEDHVRRYHEQHDRMDDENGTSRLSPHLRFGEISVRQVWHRLKRARKTAGTDAFMRQLVWREFAYRQLIAFPDIADRPLRPEFEALPTSLDDRAFEAWQQGRTGYPVVDAGMRELAATGWMHNRARMVVASFLIKHLALPWQWGAHWFWENLVDADLANNSLNWQWVAGSGVDSSPYYRIFNPQRQGARFDPEGEYVRRWVSELRSLGGSRVHGPRQGTEWSEVDYPTPMVEHEAAREAALGRYATVKARRTGA